MKRNAQAKRNTALARSAGPDVGDCLAHQTLAYASGPDPGPDRRPHNGSRGRGER